MLDWTSKYTNFMLNFQGVTKARYPPERMIQKILYLPCGSYNFLLHFIETTSCAFGKHAFIELHALIAGLDALVYYLKIKLVMLSENRKEA